MKLAQDLLGSIEGGSRTRSVGMAGPYFYLKKLLFIFKRFSVVVSLMMIIALRG